jgi:hypothetical protein
MAGKFFVTGLPRSRTAWAANFLSVAPAFCWHDGLANTPSLEAFQKKMETAEICGDSDSGLAFFYDELRALYPKARWVVLRRDPEEVVVSLVRMHPYLGMPTINAHEARGMVEAASQHLDRIAADPATLELRWSDLSLREGARALWWHCLRDEVAWRNERWEQLRDMNVTVRSADIALSLTMATKLFGRAA